MAIPQVAIDTLQLPSEAMQVIRLQQATDSEGVVTVPASFALAEGDTCTLTVVETPSIQTRLIDRKAGTLSVASATATFSIATAQLDYPGVFRGEVVILRGSAKKLRIPLYVEVQTTLDNDVSDKYDPLLIDDLRAAMYDRGREDNATLDDVEFRDNEVAWAIIRCVEIYNTLTVSGAGDSYTTASFPYKQHWLGGAQGQLYFAAAQKLLRNRLAYQAGGAAIDVNARADAYLQLGTKLMKEYEVWALGVRRANNMQKWVGRVSNPYFGNSTGNIY